MISVTHEYDAITGVLRIRAEISPDFAVQEQLYKDLLAKRYRAEVQVNQIGSNGVMIIDVMPVDYKPEATPPIEKPEKPDYPADIPGKPDHPMAPEKPAFPSKPEIKPPIKPAPPTTPIKPTVGPIKTTTKTTTYKK